MAGNGEKRNIAIVLFRLLSIYSFVVAMELLADNVQKSATGDHTYIQFLAQITGPSLLMIVCGVIIWLFAPSLAGRLSRELSEDDQSSLSLNELQDVAFAAIGLFFVVEAVSNLPYQIAIYFSVISQLFEVKSALLMLAGNIYLIGLAMKLILGICLLVGARRIGRIVRAMRRD